MDYIFKKIPLAEFRKKLDYSVDKNVLILGKNSYIGNKLKIYLNKFENYNVEIKSIRDDSWVKDNYKDYDIIFFVAGIAHRKETKENIQLYYDVNTKLAVNIAKKAREECVKHFIYISSMSVYGLTTGIVTNKTKISPNSHYGMSKAMAEQQLWEMCNDRFLVSIVRPPMVFGYNCKGNYQKLRMYALHIGIFPKYKNFRSMIYIDNLCSVLRAIMHNEQSGVYCPQNYEYLTTYNIVELISIIHGRPCFLFPIADGIFTKIINKHNILKKVFGTLLYDKNINVPKEWIINLNNKDCIFQGEHYGK